MHHMHHIPLGWCSSGLDSAGLSLVSPEHTTRERGVNYCQEKEGVKGEREGGEGGEGGEGWREGGWGGREG